MDQVVTAAGSQKLLTDGGGQQLATLDSVTLATRHVKFSANYVCVGENLFVENVCFKS